MAGLPPPWIRQCYPGLSNTGGLYGAEVGRDRGAAWEERGERASEDGARQHVDVEVARVVRHAELLGHRPHTAVDEVPRPRLVGLPLGARQPRVALGEPEEQDVADGHRKRGDDEVDWSMQLKRCVPLDAKWIISETFFRASLLT